MSLEFNFRGLHPAFLEAVARHEPSIAFALTEGNGKFVFLLFLATDANGAIVWGDLELFILLGRTQQMLRFKLLGNHKRAGDFKIRLYERHERAFREELGLDGATVGPRFVFPSFLSKLDAMIPCAIPLQSKVKVIQDNRAAIEANCKSYLEDAGKVYLLRATPLPEGKRPREETLRKLYMLGAEPDDIAALIFRLKKIRWTVCWTATEPDSNRFAEIFAKVATTG